MDKRGISAESWIKSAISTGLRFYIYEKCHNGFKKLHLYVDWIKQTNLLLLVDWIKTYLWVDFAKENCPAYGSDGSMCPWLCNRCIWIGLKSDTCIWIGYCTCLSDLRFLFRNCLFLHLFIHIYFVCVSLPLLINVFIC